MNSRRELLAAVGAATLAGCTSQGNTSPDTDTDTQSTGQETESLPDDGGETVETEQANLTGIEIHDNWAYGKTDAFRDKTAKRFIETTDAIVVDDIVAELENADNRVDGIASALETAADQYHAAKYEGRHQHILSALDLAIDEIDDELWNFDILSNMNYTQTVGETIQFSEIIIPTEGNDHTDVEIINAALKNDYNNAIHVPGETVENPADQIYKQTMNAVRNSELSGALPPHDVESIQHRLDYAGDEETDEKRAFGSWASIMGYQLFAGGHEVDSGFNFRPDQDLVPANKKVHELIDDVKYEQGDMSLNLAINEQYFNEGYDEVDGPVVVDIKSGDESWNISLQEDPNWDWKQGYPEETA